VVASKRGKAKQLDDGVLDTLVSVGAKSGAARLFNRMAGADYALHRDGYAQEDPSPKSAYLARVLQTFLETLGGALGRFALYNPLECVGWQIYDESWASFRGGNWWCDFRLGGGGDSRG
jgi:hypothetical protein